MLLAAFQQSISIRQHSSGWCSPNIVNVTGNVTVNCIGVDPRALRRLNQQLAKMRTSRDEKIREANNWAQQYHELERFLDKTGNTSEVSKQAKEYLHQGDLKKARALLDEILPKEDAEIDHAALVLDVKKDLAASHHFIRGILLELDFDFLVSRNR
jgi:DNA repair ATPase RecN